MRRAVRRAAPLAYQHSRIIFPITRRACTGRPRRRQADSHPCPGEAFPTTFLSPGTSGASFPPLASSGARRMLCLERGDVPCKCPRPAITGVL